MADQVQWRRGTTAETATFTGAQGEITVDTDKDVTVVHDGVTPGGFSSAKETAITNTTIYFDDDVGGGSVADAYILIPKANSRAPTNYFDGITLGFVTANPNTGPSTVNFTGLGVKNIKLAGGIDPLAGQVDGRIELVFDSANDWFELSVAELSADDQLKLNLYKGNNKALWPKIENSTIDVSNDIVFATGDILDSLGTTLLSLSSQLTKQLDAGFVPGNDAGGLFSGSIAANTTYHCFIIEKDSDNTIDAGFDTSVSAANIPVGYTAYRRIGSIYTDALSAIVGFHQKGDVFTLNEPSADSSGSTSTTAQLVALSVPVDGVCFANLTYVLVIASEQAGIISAVDSDDIAPDVASNFSVVTSNGATRGQTYQSIPTDSLGRIRHRETTASATHNIITTGWVDSRIV